MYTYLHDKKIKINRKLAAGLLKILRALQVLEKCLQGFSKVQMLNS